MRFTFIHEAEYDIAKSQARITYETDAVGLNFLLLDFADFLRGCGYSINEIVDLPEEDE